MENSGSTNSIKNCICSCSSIANGGGRFRVLDLLFNILNFQIELIIRCAKITTRRSVGTAVNLLSGMRISFFVIKSESVNKLFRRFNSSFEIANRSAID